MLVSLELAILRACGQVMFFLEQRTLIFHVLQLLMLLFSSSVFQFCLNVNPLFLLQQE